MSLNNLGGFVHNPDRASMDESRRALVVFKIVIMQ